MSTHRYAGHYDWTGTRATHVMALALGRISGFSDG